MDYGVSLSMESVDNVSKHKVSFSIYSVIKRVFDIFCALIGLIVLLPLSIIVKIAYVITAILMEYTILKIE
jgi:lipopolysaccharide/colanic/teichoic acid biosynthesis glycosyltransferase